MVFELCTRKGRNRINQMSDEEGYAEGNAGKPLFHQLVHGPSNVETTQITIMLTYAQEDNGNTRGMNHADERANHVTDCIAF